MLAVLVAALVGGGVDDVGEAVAVAVLEVLQVEAVGLADVGQGVGDDSFAADVADRALRSCPAP